MKKHHLPILLGIIAGLAWLATPAGSHAATIYVGEDGDVRIFAPDGTISVVGVTSGKISGLAFDSAGNLFAASPSREVHSIYKITPDGGQSLFASGLHGPHSLAFDSTGNLYVSEFLSNTIEKFTPSGTRSVFASTGLNYPVGLAFDSAGNLFVANELGNSITKLTPDGVGSLFANTNILHPIGLAFDSAGDLYASGTVGGLVQGAVEKFMPDGTGSIFAASNSDFGFFGPEGIAFDGMDNLHLLASNRIAMFTPDGAGSYLLADNGDDDLGLDYGAAIVIRPDAVPEPGAFMLLTAGLSVVFGVRRKEKSGG